MAEGAWGRRGNHSLKQQTWEVDRRVSSALQPREQTSQVSGLHKPTYNPLSFPQVFYGDRGILGFIFLREGLFPLSDYSLDVTTKVQLQR